MNFNTVKAAVAAQFERMQSGPMFRVELDKDKLWNLYLSSFPAGTNPILRKRTEHDCGCCKQFIRAIGDAIGVVNGKLVSVWKCHAGEYQPVMDAMATYVESCPITDIFLHDSRTAGTDKNFEETTGEKIRTWTHFFVNIAPRFVMKKDQIPTKLSEARSTRDVFKRALNEITDESIEMVLDLISQNSLYRGEEHRGLVTEFQRLKREYEGLSAVPRLVMEWNGTGAVARIRNTVIGTLLVDLSEGKELDEAVRGYEVKVAPMNYKRPTALITKAMIDKAKDTIESLGLTSALTRRYARLDDITINNVIFANRGTRRILEQGDVFETLTPTKSGAGNFDKVETIGIEQFITNIVPKAGSIEVMFENQHSGNLVSLIAPVDATALGLFKWDNKFSWSYNGDVTDSIKEKVKKAGGNVTGDLLCRLAWFNFDDLDLHLQTPEGKIWFGAKRLGGGMLDVDMNAGMGRTREPVENIFYDSRTAIREGNYHLYVNQYMPRESKYVGFEVEIDFLGQVQKFVYPKALKQGENVTIAKWTYSHKNGIKITESLPSTQAVREIWGIPTGAFHQVNALMYSPNHWNGQSIGNKHYFFMLEGCRNDGSARGFYNEFLRSDLDKHRKVLEVVGSKMMTEAGGEQLSGLGFSSTQRNTLICRVKGSFSRTVKVQF